VKLYYVCNSLSGVYRMENTIFETYTGELSDLFYKNEGFILILF
ncbi:unnamed protein product, partial [marine sediment metagenome]